MSPLCPQDVLNEVERNLHDAMGVARNVALDPRLVPGGGAVEMAVSRGLNDKASSVSQLTKHNNSIETLSAYLPTLIYAWISGSPRSKSPAQSYEVYKARKPSSTVLS